MKSINNPVSRIKNFVRNINYLTKHSLWDQREADIVYLTNKILNDGLYEYGIASPQKSTLHILDQDSSLALLESNPKSFVRIGDGEIRLMWGDDQPFQKFEKEIVERLYDLLRNPRPDMYVGVNWSYFEPLPRNSERANYFNARHAYDFRNFYLEHCDKNAVYLDAECTFYNFNNPDDPYYPLLFKRWKNLFANKKLAIICGEGILDSLDYDVFELAETKQFIYGPRRHAWDVHGELMDRIKAEVPKDYILVFILGMAGKAMIPEVTDLGYMAWDIGHLAKSYNAYMTKMPGTKENIDRFFAPD